MVKINADIILLAAFLPFVAVKAQVQSKLWALAPHLLDFVDPNPSAPSFGSLPTSDYSGQSALFAQNVLHDQNGNLRMFVVDGIFYDREGKNIGELSCPGYSEIIIAPMKSTAQEFCNSYWVFAATAGTGRAGICWGIALFNPSGSGFVAEMGRLEGKREDDPRCIQAHMAISTILSDGFRYLYVASCTILNRFRISETNFPLSPGVEHAGYWSYQQSLFFASLNQPVRSELEFSKKHNADTYFLGLGGLNQVAGTWSVFIISLDNEGRFVGTIDHSLGALILNQPGRVPKGVEFSPDGRWLYFSEGTGLHVYEIDSGDISQLTDVPIDFSESQIELGHDGKMYLAADNRLGYIESPNNPLNSAFFNAAGTNFGPETYPKTYVGSQPPSGLPDTSLFDYGLRLLNDQIDQQNYDDLLLENPACCNDVIVYHALTYVVSTPGIWTAGAGNNPFDAPTETIFIKNELRFTSGTIVTINSMTLRFGQDAKLIIERGARLNLSNGATLTAVDCPEIMWSGVELWGTRSSAQLPIPIVNAGWLRMTGGATISDAFTGVSLVRRGVLSDDPLWDYSGGIIQATRSNFINNRLDVEFMPYPFRALSFFRECVFSRNAVLKVPDLALLPHVTMLDVNEIAFVANEFSNIAYPEGRRSTGIQAVNSKFTATFRCTLGGGAPPCPDANRDGNKFINLDIGIRSFSTDPLQTVTLNHNFFDRCFRGVQLSGMDAPRIKGNDFNIPNQGYGMSLRDCALYKIDDNEFFSDDGGHFGLIISNSNPGCTTPGTHEVYRNFFRDLWAGAIALGCNRGPGMMDGLVFRCNMFTRSIAADIYVTNPGIATFQGGCDSAANNIFSVLTPTVFGHLWQTTSTSWMSYQYLPSSTSQTEPLQFNTINTFPTECTTAPNFVPGLHCPKTVEDTNDDGGSGGGGGDGGNGGDGGGGDGGNVGGEGGAEERYSDEIAAIDSDRQIGLEALKDLDGGNSARLLRMIANESTGQRDLMDALIEASPLSTEVLVAFLTDKQALPPIGPRVIVEVVRVNVPLSEPLLAQVLSLDLGKSAEGRVKALQRRKSKTSSIRASVEATARVALEKSASAFSSLVSQIVHASGFGESERDLLNSLFSDQGRNSSRCAEEEAGGFEGNALVAVGPDGRILPEETPQGGSDDAFCALQEDISLLMQAVRGCLLEQNSRGDQKGKGDECSPRGDKVSVICRQASLLLARLSTVDYAGEIPISPETINVPDDNGNEGEAGGGGNGGDDVEGGKGESDGNREGRGSGGKRGKRGKGSDGGEGR